MTYNLPLIKLQLLKPIYKRRKHNVQTKNPFGLNQILCFVKAGYYILLSRYKKMLY